jgi:hypothetical protein
MAFGMCEATLARDAGSWPIPFVSLTARIQVLAALPALVLAVGACGGAQAGGQTGEESSGGCVFTLTALSDEERSPLGFSPAQVMALADGELRAGFEWSQASGLAYGPETGMSEVTVRVAQRDAAGLARIDRAESSPYCEDHVRVPVTVSLATAGGALDESLQTDLTATSPDEASVTTTVKSGELRGSFAFAPGALGSSRFIRLEVDLRLRSAEFGGRLLAGVESGDDGSGTASFRPAPLACWGDVSSLPSCSE